MDPQGSTPGAQSDVTSHSSNPTPADITATPVAPSSVPAQSGDLLGRITDSYTNGTPITDTPSQPTPTPQTPSQNQEASPSGDSVEPKKEATPKLEVDSELERWATSQKLQLTTPAEVTLAKRLRDTQAALHQAKNQKVTDLQNTPNGDDEYTDPLESDVSSIKGRLARFEFFDANPEAKALEPKMVEYVTDLMERGDTAAAMFYANNWSHLYNAVKSQSPTIDPQITEQARLEERENLAKAQHAAPPVPAATSSTPKPTASMDEQIANMTQEEYNEWRKSNNPFASR